MEDGQEGRFAVLPVNKGQALAYIRGLSRELAIQTRDGAIKDNPEGSRYIRMSETLLVQLVEGLDACFKVLHNDPPEPQLSGLPK